MKQNFRVAGLIRLMIKAKCETGWPDKKDCFKHNANIEEWCWPCKARWAHRKDAAKFVAPIDDIKP